MLPQSELQHQMGFIKASFGFKMSKKVAELTQVVHMLFTRNHEKESELDCIKVAYEKEIFAITKKARERIDQLQYEIRELERQKMCGVNDAAEGAANFLKETQLQVDTLKRDLQREKMESANLRDLLTKAHSDIDKMRQSSFTYSQSLKETQGHLDARTSEVQKLERIYKVAEEKWASCEKYLEEMKMRCLYSEKQVSESQEIMEKLNKALHDSHRKSDELLKRIEALEKQIKSDKQKTSKMDKRFKVKDFPPNFRLKESKTSHREVGKEVEMDQLRREIEWLRMELNNREGNYNRVFAKFQPVVVSSAKKPPQQSSQQLQEARMMVITPASSSSSNSLNISSKINLSQPQRNKSQASYSRHVSSTPTVPHKSLKPDTSQLRQPSPNKHLSSNFRLVYTK